MVDNAAGYLIVERNDRILIAIGIPHYKGLYRTPDWSQEAYESGFNDPLVFGTYTNSYGLIPILREAVEVVQRFAEIEPIAGLEIVWTRQAGSHVDVPLACTYLGIDVACTAPFWSILADRPGDDFVKRAAEFINPEGLFPNADRASWYLSEYRRHHPEKAEIVLYLWEVYALAPDA